MTDPTSSSAPILEVRNLHMTFKRGLLKRGFKALRGVDLQVERGSVFGLLGPNGAGKTTLVKVLLGLNVGWKGTAKVFGLAPGSTEPRRRIGYLPEAHRLPPYLTGRQVLELFGMMCGREKSWLKERIPIWLEKVDMERDADRKLKEYSKGMQQRIGLAQALIHEPDLIFLDEPTDGVDPVGRAAIREVIAELKRRDVTVFLNSHLLMEVEAMCDRVVILDQGAILREGTLEELTPRTGAVRFELSTEAYDPERLLTGVGSNLVKDGRFFELAANEQEVGEAIDRLRAGGVSIRSITPRKLTLEEAFIGIVSKDSGQAPPDPGTTKSGSDAQKPGPGAQKEVQA